MDDCACKKWNFTEVLLEDKEQPTTFYHISAIEHYVIAAGIDNNLRVWSRQTKSADPFRLPTPAKIIAIGISSNPLRIYISTQNQLQIFKVKEGAQSCCTLIGVRNVKRIRFQHGLLILCSNTCIVGFRFKEDKSTWDPEFQIQTQQPTSITFLDSLLVHETQLLVLSMDEKSCHMKQEKVLGWKIYNYKKLAADYSKTQTVIEFQSTYYWPAQSLDLSPLGAVLDISSEGFCLVSLYNSDVWIINLMEKANNPVSGKVGRIDGYDMTHEVFFLRACGSDGHQPTFAFTASGTKRLGWRIVQRRPILADTSMDSQIKNAEGYDEDKRNTQDDRLKQGDRIISRFKSREIDCDNNIIYSSCYHYSSGIALISNSKEVAFRGKTISAVTIANYAEQVEDYNPNRSESLTLTVDHTSLHPIDSPQLRTGNIMLPDQFKHFSLLPSEIRNHVWEIASLRPKIVNILLHDNEIIGVRTDTASEALFSACKESHGIFLNHNNDYIKFKKKRGPILSFNRDFFVVDGLNEPYEPTNSLTMALFPLQKIVIPKPIKNIFKLLRYSLRVQEVWVRFGDQTSFYPISASAFRRCWSAHHCDNESLSNVYASMRNLGSNQIICPACWWREEFRCLEETDIMAPQVVAPHRLEDFILTVPYSLPLFPTVDDVILHKYPMIRWVRRDKSDILDLPEDMWGMNRTRCFHASALEFLKRYRNRILNSERMIERVLGLLQDIEDT